MGQSAGKESSEPYSDDLSGPDMHAVLPTQTLWKFNPKDPRVLRVYFMSDGCKKWMYKGEPLTKSDILTLAQLEWDVTEEANGKYVPKFIATEKQRDAHIRVEFENKPRGGSWSKLGAGAQEVKDTSKPTMVFNFNQCATDYQIEHTILHEFGHALGLAHEHQHPDYLDAMNKFIDAEGTMSCLNIRSMPFYIQQWAKLNMQVLRTKFDEHSIMHYPTKRGMLKKEYQELCDISLSDFDTHVKTEDFSPDEKYMLKCFVRHLDHVASRPSKLDKETIVKAYFEEFQKTPDYVPPTVQDSQASSSATNTEANPPPQAINEALAGSLANYFRHYTPPAANDGFYLQNAVLRTSGSSSEGPQLRYL